MDGRAYGIGKISSPIYIQYPYDLNRKKMMNHISSPFFHSLPFLSPALLYLGIWYWRNFILDRASIQPTKTTEQKIALKYQIKFHKQTMKRDFISNIKENIILMTFLIYCKNIIHLIVKKESHNIP